MVVEVTKQGQGHYTTIVKFYFEQVFSNTNLAMEQYGNNIEQITIT